MSGLMSCAVVSIMCVNVSQMSCSFLWQIDDFQKRCKRDNAGALSPPSGGRRNATAYIKLLSGPTWRAAGGSAAQGGSATTSLWLSGLSRTRTTRYRSTYLPLCVVTLRPAGSCCAALWSVWAVSCRSIAGMSCIHTVKLWEALHAYDTTI